MYVVHLTECIRNKVDNYKIEGIEDLNITRNENVHDSFVIVELKTMRHFYKTHQP